MINLRNSLKLAGTKLKTRKIRLTVTVIISSLMFAVLSFGVISFTGFTNSVNNFSQVGLNNRFFVGLYLAGSHSELYRYIESKEGRSKAREFNREVIERKAQRAKELGIFFDKKSALDQLNKNEYVPLEIGVEEKMAEHYMSINPKFKKKLLNQENISRLTKDYAVLNQIKLTSINLANGRMFAPNQQGAYDYIDDRKLGAVDYKLGANNVFDGTKDKTTIDNFSLAPESINQVYRFTDYQFKQGAKTIPLLLPIDMAEAILGFKKLSPRSSSQDLLRRRQEVQARARGYKIKQCYLNELALSELQQAYDHQKRKNDKDYIKPEVVYGLPANQACQTATILSDQRSAADKKRSAGQRQFDFEFNQMPLAALAHELEFEIVGLLPPSHPDFGDYNLATTLINIAIGSPNLEPIVPESDFARLMSTNPSLGEIFKNNKRVIDYSSRWFVEFKHLEQAEKFINETYRCKNVLPSNTPSTDKIAPDIAIDPAYNSGACQSDFIAGPALNNRLHLKSAIAAFFRVVLIALVAVVAVASVIMAGTVGRLIADSRRETAVFRAIGFKRLDIARVYGSYSLIICLIIIVLSLGLGLVAAIILASRLDQQLSTQAILATNASDFNLKMSLLGISPLYLGMLAVAILVVGGLAISLPLLRNLRRNPIKDMRDE